MSEVDRRATELRPMLYPELEHEALPSLVRRVVRDAGYSLEGLVESHALRGGDRSSQVLCAALERLFLFELWIKGVCYGSGRADDPRAMGAAIGAFVIGRASIDEMEKRFPWVRFHDVARAHERGQLVEQTWRWRLERNDGVARVLRPLMEACAARPRLSALLPFTSHEALLFSRTTGYPYDSLAVCAVPVARSGGGPAFTDQFVPGMFRLMKRIGPDGGHSLGEGDADWAATMLESQVPVEWGGAVDGTADDAGR